MAEVLEYLALGVTAVGTAAAVWDVQLKSRQVTRQSDQTTHLHQPNFLVAAGDMSNIGYAPAEAVLVAPHKFCVRCGTQLPLQQMTCAGCGYQFPDLTEKPRLGWTFTGFIPWGLFGFLYGATFLGIIGLTQQILLFTNQMEKPFWGTAGTILSFFYILYIGFMGRKIAWKKRKWPNAEAFNSVMRRWEGWGIAFFIFNIVMLLWMFASGMMQGFQQALIDAQQKQQPVYTDPYLTPTYDNGLGTDYDSGSTLDSGTDTTTTDTSTDTSTYDPYSFN